MTFGAFTPWDNPPIPEGALGFSITYKLPSRILRAEWEEKTGEMLLLEEDRPLLATRCADAFEAGLRLLRGDATIHFMGWTLRRRRR